MSVRNVVFLRNNKIIYNVYHRLRLIKNLRNKKKFLEFKDCLMKNRFKGLEFISELALKPLFWEREKFKTNEKYSHDIALKTYCNQSIGEPLSKIIEHGIVINKHLIENANNYAGCMGNIVMSRARAEFLISQGIPSIAIGPYIHYARSIFKTDELKYIKNKMGKTLLYFPSHSTSFTSVEDSYKFINDDIKVATEGEEFDTVLICGYFIDINNGLFDNITKEDNYKFISCGDRCGPLFLSLLKTYILLADIVASNTIGTQTGYSLFFNKPYWVIGNTDITRYYDGSMNKVEEEINAMHKELIGDMEITYLEYENYFRNKSYDIDHKTYKLTSLFWGFDDIKTEGQLRNIIYDRD
jgi:hypothetical protein